MSQLARSFKYTLRSMFRDLARGSIARRFVYPKLMRNEYSESALTDYVRDHNHDEMNSTYAINKIGFVDASVCTIDKSDVRSNYSKFLRKRTLTTMLRNRIQTSGSTGSPLTIVQDVGAVIREEAFVYRQLRWAGFEWGERRAWLRGEIVCDPSNRSQTYWCRDYWANTLMLSSYHIAPTTAPMYIAKLESFDPVLIQAYPTSIGSLAAWLNAEGVRYKGRSLTAVVTSSETLTADMRSSIESAFGVPVFDWYGQAERVAAIGTCELGNYHALTDYGLFELLPDDDGYFEIVGSGYNNKAMPLLHYRTGDRVRFTGRECECGRVFPVIDEILGRKDKTITLADGRAVTRLGHVFQGVSGIIEGQVVYLGDNVFELRVVPADGWTESSVQKLTEQFNRRVAGVSVSVKTVDAIPRGANGKYEFVKLENTRKSGVHEC